MTIVIGQKALNAPNKGWAEVKFSEVGRFLDREEIETLVQEGRVSKTDSNFISEFVLRSELRETVFCAGEEV